MSFYIIPPPVNPRKDCHCSRQFQFLTLRWMFFCPSGIYASSNTHCNQLLCFGDCIIKITSALKQLSPQNCLFSSVAQSCPTLQPHESQHTRPPCPSPTPRVHSNSRPSSRCIIGCEVACCASREGRFLENQRWAITFEICDGSFHPVCALKCMVLKCFNSVHLCVPNCKLY